MSKKYYALQFKDGDFLGLGWDGRMEESIVNKTDLKLWNLQDFLYEDKIDAEYSLKDVKIWYAKDWDNVDGHYSHMWSYKLTKEEMEGIKIVEIDLKLEYKVVE